MWMGLGSLTQRLRWLELTSISGKVPTYELGVFLASLAVFSLLMPFGDFDTIIGDNICQAAYWRILQHHAFVGSLGAASMKPGLILLLGPIHDLSLALLGSTALIKAALSLTGAALTTVVARIAKENGGPIAGIGAAAYLLTRTLVQDVYTRGASMIVFLPLLFIGVWLFSRNRQTAGALVLCLAALVRIEAFMVLFWLAVGEQLLQRKWRAFIVSSLAVAVTVAITVVVYYRIQGSVARFNAGGPAVGYLFSREPSVVVRFVGSLKYTAIATYEMLFEHCGFPFLGAPALVAFVRAPTRRFYLATFGIAAFLMVYVTAGQGNSDVRYFDFITPLVAAFGAAGVVQLFELGGQVESKLLRRLLPLSALLGVACFVLELPNVVCSVSLVFITVGAAVALRQLRASLPSLPPWLASGAWLLLIAALFVSAVRSGAWGEAPKPHGYTVDAKSMIEHELFPRGQRVLIDDDVLYGVLVDDYKVFRRAGSLQNFNVQDDAQREEILGKTDYLVMSRGGHFFFYLRYDPLQRGKSDPFRAAVLRARNGKEANAYGYRITPFKTTRRLLILKVEKA